MAQIYDIRPADRMQIHAARLSERNPSNVGWLRFWNFADSSGGLAPRELTGAVKDSWTFRTLAKRGVSFVGPGIYTGGGTYTEGGAYCDDAYRTSITSKLTVVCLFTSMTSASSEFILGNTALISAGDYNWGLYRNHGSATLAAYVKNSSGTVAAVTGASNLIPTGKTVLAAMTYDGATIRAYVDGIQIGTAAQTGNVQANNLSTTICDWAAVTAQAVWIYYAGIANRVWSPDELLALGANWWSLFEEIEEPVFYSLPSGNTFVFTASGGITFGGAAGINKVMDKAAAGGITFGGSADVSTVGLQTRVVSPSGGISFGGSASPARARSVAAAGGISFGGAATVAFAESQRTVVASGGIVFGGSANVIAIPFGSQRDANRGIYGRQGLLDRRLARRS